MNTHDIDIELPPLPSLHIAPSVEPVDYPQVAQALMDYARAAVEADRKRRGVSNECKPVVPVLYNSHARRVSEILKKHPITPQPAEPVTDRYELALDALADLLEEAEWLQRDLNIELAKNGLAPIEEGRPIINARRLLAANVPSNKGGTSSDGRVLYEEP